MSISCKQNDVNDDIINFWMKFVINEYKRFFTKSYEYNLCVTKYVIIITTILVTYQKLPHGYL